uniref:CSON013528 protein n=1 Tax=Culicoides sonorensis TaxID=179676 RepID=A0A336M878_CULSO
MRRRRINVLRNLQSFSQGFLAVFLLLKLCSFILAAQPGYLDFDNLPDTNFTCAGKVIGGYYADLETSCQMFHVCVIGQGEEPMDIKFLCLNGTVFDQETRVCERVDEVDCSKSERFYYLNLELYGNTMIPSPDDDTTPLQSSTTQSTTTERITSTSVSTSALKSISPSTKTPGSTTRKPTSSMSTQPSIQKQSEPEYIEYYDYEDEPSSKPITSSSKSSPTPSQYYKEQEPQKQQPNYQTVANLKPLNGDQQHQHHIIQKGQQYINNNNSPYSHQQNQPQRQSLYSQSQQSYNYERPGLTETMLAEVSQPKPFEGYRRQPQPYVPLTLPQYGDISRQSKTYDSDINPQPIERKDTKRSDPQYNTHIEPDTSASDPNLQKHEPHDDINKSNDELERDKNYTQNSYSVVTSDNNNNGYSQHNISHNSYEKLLTPQKNMYISNLPKVINTVSVSVSDQNGKKLNLSLENIWAEQQQKNSQLKSYDDYKEDEISAALLEPFFLDVPKLSNRNKQNIIINPHQNNSTR